MGERPNILLIVSDDHGYADMSWRGVRADVHTPHLDRFAASALSCERAYVSAPICSPSRLGMITGAYQQRWGSYWFDSAQFPSGYATIPQVLAPAGYRSGYFGKVHYGHSDDYASPACPDQHGFDDTLYGLAGLSMGRLHYLKHGSEYVTALGPEAARVNGVQPLVDNGTPVSCDQHLTEAFTDRAVEFISAARPEPFFCLVAYNAVHNFAWQLPAAELAARDLPAHPDYNCETARYVDWYDGAIAPNLDHGRDYYLAQLELMDRQIGRLLDTLEATGAAANTLVIYLTDNGGSACNFGDNTPLAGSKYTLLEGGIRVPFLIRWPGHTRPGTTSTQLVSALDILPTCAGAAGVELPANPVDGRDLAPVLAGQAGHETLHFDCGFQWAVLTSEWKLRWVDPTSPTPAALERVEHTAVGTGLTLTRLGTPEDLAEDVSGANPEVVRRLLAARTAWQQAVSNGTVPAA